MVLKSGTMTRAVLTNVINDLDKKNDVGALLIGFNADRRYWDDPTNKYRHVVELAGYKDRRNLNTDLIAFRKALCDSTASCSFTKTFLSKCIVGLRFNSHRRLQQLKMKEYANAFGYKDDGSDFCVEFEK
ncbi:hypothetical protein Ddye_005614 [Dipteronia dyeriana]|uniref:Uncharacterized protein n=1 Tax=Dipteronia dyeriana TaxID=168575 RepID=A0AAE0CPV9_9ROSI|nr:hypothetical protein Ddye_005614 [Dipteronia dyeriana]